MGKVRVKIRVTNFTDTEQARLGHIPAEAVRSLNAEALVDTGASIMALPENLVEALGLNTIRETPVNYANGTQQRKRIVMVQLEFTDFNRGAVVECVVEARGTTPLVGQIPLEYMDLHVDCKNGTLHPRPGFPDMPAVDLLKSA